MAAAAALVALLPACGGSSGGGGPSFDAAVAAQAIQTYSNLMHETYSDVVELAVALDVAIDAFVANADANTLAAARQAWLDARPFYIQSELARFYDGPIDGPPDGIEVFVNAWPLSEAHIDSVAGNVNAGIVNDPVGFPTIDEATVRSANMAGGEENVSSGWHAIEFLLWGQDFSSGGPGARPASDYDLMAATLPNPARRRQYLAVLSDLLVEDITFVRDQWAPGTGAYRTEVISLAQANALSRIMTGIGTLAFGELRGERLVTPFFTKLQEDEHSCFSDTTHLDHLNDLVGIRNAWFGSYASSDGSHDVTGTGLRAVALTASPALASQITAILDALLVTLSSPTLQPFDQAILGDDSTPGRQTIQQALDLLADFNVAFSSLAAAMDVDITTQIP